jgi:hypothetical protein
MLPFDPSPQATQSFNAMFSPTPEPQYPDYNDVMSSIQRSILDQRISAGADGGMGDNVGGPCQESYRNLMDKFYP